MLPLTSRNASAPGWMKAEGTDFIWTTTQLTPGKDNHDGSLHEFAPPRQR